VQKRSLIAVPILVAAVLVLSACAGGTGTPSATDAATDTPSATPTETQAATGTVFTMPADCNSMLPQSRVDSFAAQNIILLGGPGGKYPNYYTNKTPEEQAGGISCVWGNSDETVTESTIEISVAPLSSSTSPGVVQSLLDQGLNEAQIDGGISYAQIGDETSAPAVLNVIRDDSWISVLEALGGEAFFDEATQIAAEVDAAVYK
jgi:hypothetical protein